MLSPPNISPPQLLRKVVALTMSGAALFGAGFLSTATTPTAGASSHSYCNRAVAPMSPCTDQPIASDVQYNAADYPGAGTVSVCEKADPSTAFNPALTSRRCGNNHADSQKDLVGNVKYLEQNQLAVGNNSSTQHTVIGTYS